MTQIKMTLCEVCKDEGWVCEDHPDKAWGSGFGCCEAAGKPCLCNTFKPPWNYRKCKKEEDSE